MAIPVETIRESISDGTLIRIERAGNEYVATALPSGEDVTNLVRRHVRKTAFDAESGLRTVYTKTGGVQFRKIDNSELAGIQVDPPEPVAVPTVDAEVGMTQEEIITFINDSYSLKPADLIMSSTRWKYAMRTVIRGGNLMFTGPAGCGKTLACQAVARTFPDRPYFYFNLGASQDPRGMLIGNTHYSPTEGTFVAEALFAQAIQTPNAIILLDEVSRAHDDAANILMTVLDRGQRYLRIDERPDTPTIDVAPGVVFLGTANIGNEYTGTRVMDRAFLDRFAVVEMEPLSAAEEVDLLSRLYPTVETRWLTALGEIAEVTRKDILSDDPKLSTIISTRATVEMAGLINDGFSLAESAEVCIYPFFDPAGGPDSERTFIKALVQKHLPTEFDNKETPWAADESAGGDSSSTSNKIPW